MNMRIKILLTLAVAAVLSTTGCAGPEKKFGRGFVNSTELLRMGELRRSMEQTSLWDNQNSTFNLGLVRGINRTMTRTVVGVFEMATFPIPTPTYNSWFASDVRVFPDPSIKNKHFPFGGMVISEYPVFPDSYRPNLISDSIFHTDTSLGFSGGDIAPMIPGSRFRIFEN